MIKMANAIFLEAMRRVGEMLQQTERAKGATAIPGVKGFSGSTNLVGPLDQLNWLGGTKSEPPSDDPPTLAEIGLSKKESALYAPCRGNAAVGGTDLVPPTNEPPTLADRPEQEGIRVG
jgi:hypothetical protein